MLRNNFLKIVVVSMLGLSSSILKAAPVELVTNGGFESGLSGWTPAGLGNATISTTNPASGVNSVFLTNNSPSANLLQQSNLGQGLLAGSEFVTLSFDYRGTATAGGVLFGEVITLPSAGAAPLVLNGPLFPDADPNVWTNFSNTFQIGPDAAGGILLQMNAPCGADANCVSDYYIDNISLTADVSAVPVPAAVWLFGSGLLGLIGAARRKIQA